MIIISDCFTEKVDEGCIKVAVSLAKRLKALRSDVTLISYKNHSAFADKNMKLNGFFLNPSLFRILRSKPSGPCTRRCCENHGYSLFSHSLNYRGKKREIISPLFRLKKRPREDIERDSIDTHSVKMLDILFENTWIVHPLFGVVIPSKMKSLTHTKPLLYLNAPNI